MEKKQDSKQKIFGVASKMFADKGFDGTSIRDIAKEANVSLASINYHFRSKHQLYLEILVENHKKMEAHFKSLESLELSFEDLVVEIYKKMFDHASDMTNVFRMITSDFSLPEDVDVNEHIPETCQTPPGIGLMIKKIQQCVDQNIDIHVALWCAYGLFVECAHFTLMVSKPPVFCDAKRSLPIIKHEVAELWLKNKAIAMITYLREHRQGVTDALNLDPSIKGTLNLEELI